MKNAALYIHGRIVVGSSHLEAFEKLAENEKDEHITSGFFDTETGEFSAEIAKEHFFEKKILLIRHGEAKTDHLDPSLSETGIREVINITKYLSQFDLREFSAFTSPLLRCIQTAQILHEITKITFTVKPDIIEMPSFLTENEAYFIQNRYNEFPDFNWPNREDWLIRYESKGQFLSRVGNVLSNLPNKCILISHCGFITNMARLALCDEKVQSVPTASLTYIDNQEIKCLGKTNENYIQVSPVPALS